MPLKLLHVSDIHFQSPAKLGWDADDDHRRELVTDVSAWVRINGPIDAILVGGDIAFSAKPEEYRVATDWLDQLRDAAGGLDRGQVWTVPGNHDIDRSTIQMSPIGDDFRCRVRECSLDDVDALLTARLAVDPAAEGLIAPLAAYNDFALGYGCQTTHRQLQWFDHTLDLDGHAVGLTGLNSVIASGVIRGTDWEHKAAQERMGLVLGVHQCKIQRMEAVHIVMAHHPPSWIRDWENVEPFLKRAHLWLFGHEHAFDAKQEVVGGPVQVAAGAVGPEPTGDGDHGEYLPTYNIITLSMHTHDFVDVLIEPRRWHRTWTRFDEHPSGATTFRVAIDPVVELGPAPESEDDHREAPQEPSSASPLAEEPPPVGADDASPEERVARRRVGVEFLQLSSTRRLQIAEELGVSRPEDHSMPDIELYPTLLRRIRDAGLIDELTGMI